MADLAKGFDVVSNLMRDLSSRSRSTAALSICSDSSQMSGSFFVNLSRPGCGSTLGYVPTFADPAPLTRMFKTVRGEIAGPRRETGARSREDPIRTRALR
ncbi:MAG: hypothetical protein E6K65_03645 [Nitrospirae bacterium]|nr:MAG: hypothetical protein E6K65_03645 [Nitrospirota bacterium]